MKYIIIGCLALFTTPCNLFAVDTAKPSATLHKMFQEKISLVKHVEFSPDGKYFLLRGDRGSIYVWHVKDFSLFKEITLIKDRFILIRSEDTPHSIVDASFMSDSKSIYAGLDNGTAVIIDLDSGKKTTYSFGEIERNAKYSAISRSGTILAMDSSYVNTENNEVKRTPGLVYSDLAITDDGKYIVSSSYHFYCVKIVDTATGKEIRWRPASFFIITQRVQSIDVSPDNDTVAAGLANGDVRLYSIRQNTEIGNLSHGGWAIEESFSPDGKLVATASDNNKVKIWDVASRSRINTWKTEERPTKITWLRETPWLAVGTDNGELIIVSSDGEEAVFKDKVMEGGILDIDYLPSESLLLLCDEWSNVLVYQIKLDQP